MAPPFSIAFIALRTGQQHLAGGAVQAVVVGQAVNAGVPEWRYALYNLPDLERVLVAAQRRPDTELGAGDPWAITPHPLSLPLQPGAMALRLPLTTDGDYRRAGPAPEDLLWPDERADLLSANDLPAGLRASLTTPAVTVDNPGGLPPIAFAMPLRDVVRILFYENDYQPTDPAAAGPLLVLDTCFPVLRAGATSPQPAVRPLPGAVEPAFGSSVILFAQPIPPSGPGPVVNAGALFGFAVLGQFRLALNGHASTRPSETPRGFVRFYALNPGPGRSLFNDTPAVPVTADGVGIGPRFDSMRIGFSIAGWSGSAATARVYSRAQPGWLGELSRFSRRARDYTPPLLHNGMRGGTILTAAAWASDFPLRGVLAAGGGIATNATTRELGFRFVQRPDPLTAARPSRLALRFEAGYWLSGALKNLSFLPPCPQAWSGAHWHLFAQEQPLDDINGDLAPRSRLRWVLTARMIDGVAVGKTVLSAIYTRVQALKLGLQQAHDGAPLSLLPLIAADAAASGNLVWHLVGSHIDTAPYSRDLAPADIAQSSFEALEPRFIADMWNCDYLPASGPGDAEKDVNKQNTATLYCAVDASFPAMTLAAPSSAQLGYCLRIAAPTTIDTLARQAEPQTAWPSYQPAISARDPGVSRGAKLPRGVFLGVDVKDIASALAPATVEVEMVLGALALRFAKAGPPTPSLRGLLRLLVTADAAGAAIEALLQFPIADAYPAGQDDLPDEARIALRDPFADPLADPGADPDAPLCLMLTPPAAAGTQTLTLYAIESVAPRSNPSVDLSLVTFATESTTSPTPGATPAATPVAAPPAPVQASGTLLVIDPAPLRVAAVRVRSLAAAQSDESNQVAVWNGGGGAGLSWRLADDSGVVSLLLPPQVIGEAMEKNRGGDGVRPPDINETTPAAARFGSLTRLDITPAYFDTRYVEPGWNLRRIMGFAGQRAPGAGLRDLRLELAYGLLTRLTPSGTTTRIAELGAAIGAPAAPLSGEGVAVADYVVACNAMLGVAARRPAIDRLWQGDPLADFVMERGVQFGLRLPRSNSGAPGMTQLRWPFPGALPPDLPPGLAAGFSIDPRDSASFPGGIAWAFESSNILRSVYTNPVSSDGRVEGLHLSALGGTGHQRALFDQGRTAIELDTAMGRVHRYALERIGRIGALWNRAKHVIIYERTVSPSAQFYNFDPIGLEQDLLLGRPVLRKVEEYVQILQPSRRFPENGKAVDAAGCLTGVTFGSLLIRVDSRWGSDVRSQGWQVPLWNTAFAAPPNDASNPDDPSFIYPKPHIRLHVMGANGVETGLDVDEPEKLVFYTSVLPGERGDATDLWRPVAAVDFLDLPPPQPATRTPGSADLIDAPMPPALDHVPGHERLTLALAPSKDAVFISNGRQSSGPVVKLRNVTIGRAVQAAGNGTHAAARATGVALAQTVGGIAVAVDSAIGRLHAALAPVLAVTPVNPDDVRKAVTLAVGGAFRGAIDAIATVPALDGPTGATVQAAGADRIKTTLSAAATLQQTRIQLAASDLAGTLQAAVSDALDGVVGALNQTLKTLSSPGADVTGCAQNAALALTALGQALAAANADTTATLQPLRTSAGQFVDAAGIAFGAFEDYAAAGAAALRAGAAIPQATTTAAWPATQAQAAVTQAAIAMARGAWPVVGGARLDPAALPADATRLLAGIDTCLSALDALTAAIARAAAATDDLNRQIVAAQPFAATAVAIDAFSNRVLKIGGIVSNALAAIAILRPLTPANLAAAQAQANTILAALDALPAAPPSNWSPSRRSCLAAVLPALNKAAPAPVCRSVMELTAASTNAAFTAVDAAVLAAHTVIQGAAQTITALAVRVDDAANFPGAVNVVSKVIDVGTGYCDSVRDRLQSFCKTEIDTIVATAGDIQRQTVSVALQSLISQQISAVQALQAGFGSQVARLQTELASYQTAATKAQNDAVAGLAQRIIDGAGLAGARAGVNAIEGFAAALPTLPADLTALLTNHNNVVNFGDNLATAINAAVANNAAAGLTALTTAVQDATATVSQTVQDSLGGYVASVHGALSDALGVDPVDAASQAQRVFQDGSDTLRLLRAVGDPPTADMLGFNRSQVAYVFQEANQFVNMTPAISLVNRVSATAAAAGAAAAAADNLLSTFGVRLPLSSIGAQLMPDALKNLDISSLMPDFAGIKLDGLFKNLRFPSLSDSDAVKITHGFDVADKSAWLQAAIDVPFDDTAPLMDFGPVQILVEDARFTSTARIAAGPGGAQKSMQGQIAGDWHVVCAGQTLISFLQTGLSFDHTGHLKFDIQPDRVELADALQFLTELLAEFSGDGGLQVLPYPDGLPSGVAAVLDMVLPPVQTGAFGISDLSLHVLFAVAALPEFEIVTELGLGSKLAPFTLNVWLLNGGGFVTSRLRYLPTHRPAALLGFSLEVGIVAGVGLGFSLGIVSGGVWLQIGCAVALNWSTGPGGSTTAISAYLLLRGCVDVAGLITVSLSLILEITYDGSRMIGSGALHIRVKISIFYTVSVSEHVQYTFIGKQKSNSRQYSSSYA